MKNQDGVEEEIKKINAALGEDSKYECKDYFREGTSNKYESK